jgi:ribose 5-phosphate isomerase B
MKIAIGSDHAGFDLKESIKKFLEEKGYKYKDFGTHDNNSCDYPDYGLAVSEAVKEGIFDKGILICGSGIGLGIVANKVPGIRAGVCYNTELAILSRTHNDANVLVLPGRFITEIKAIEITEIWLKTDFSGDERHVRRIGKITKAEDKF